MTHATHIDPVIIQKLRAFGRRRRRLIVLRGLAAALVSLLAAMTLIAIPDYLFLLADSTRLTLSIIGYAAALVALWFTCVRLMVHIPSATEVARMVEATAPGLREDLISAVELGSSAHDDRLDSPVFRALLQQSVATRMSDIDVRSLLPWKLVAGWLLAGAAVLAICIALSFVPGVSFGSMLGRAMMPLADIERVAKVKIAILEPSPGNTVMPEGDAVRIVAETTGPAVDDAVLETIATDGTKQKLPMTRQDDRRFAGTFVIGKDPVTYRVLAGDGATRRFTLTSKPRPYVTAFQKTFRFPSYTKLPASTRTDKDGDVAAIEGTEVDLVLKVDQPIASGELRIEQGRETKTIKLNVTGSEVTATLPMDQSGTYKVALVAAQTNFENRFSPKYEINAQPDLPPRVELTQPKANVMLPPDEILGLAGTAEDDLALVSVEQLIRVNGGPWQSVTLVTEPGAQATVQRNWDLFEHKLRAGDRVTTKLVATDRKGNKGESNPLIVTVASPEFDSKRLAVLEAKTKADAVLKELLGRVEQHRRDMEEAVGKINATPPDQKQQFTAYIDAGLAAAKGLADDAAQALKDMQPLTRAVGRGADAHDFAATARIIAQMQYDDALAAQHAIRAAASAASGDERNKATKIAVAALRESQAGAQLLSRRMTELTAGEALAVVTNDLRTLSLDQQRVAAELDGTPDANAWKRIARREGIAANHAKFLEEIIGKYSRGERKFNRSVGDSMRKLADQREAMDKLLSTGEPDQRLGDASRKMKDTIDQAYVQIRVAEANEARNLAKIRRGFDERLDPAYRTLDRMAKQVEESARIVARLESPDKRPRDPNQLAKDQQRLAAAQEWLKQVGWPGAIAAVKALSSIEESRTDSDARFAADFGLIGRALSALAARYAADRDTDPESLKRVGELAMATANAAHVLETVHRVGELDATAGELLALEQWKVASPAAHTLHPRQWDYIDPHMEFTARSLQWNQAWIEPMQLLNSIPHREPARLIRTEMEVRRQPGRNADRIEQHVTGVKADLDRVLALMQKDAAKSRALLESVAPKMAQLMKQAAEQARKLEEQTKQAAAEAAKQPAAKNGEQVQQVAKQQQEVRAQLADVVDAVRQDANLQNLLTNEGRERARDADAATAMLREPITRADAAVEKAAKSTQPADQQRALEQAAAEQAKVADTLQKLADHYQKMEAGQDVTADRQAMREAEKQMGVDRPLNQQYDQLDKLAEMSKLPPQELMKQLEQELGQNRPMQKELDQISRSALQQAQADLNKAAEMEKQQAKKVDAVAQQQEKTRSELGKQLAQLRKEAQEVAEQKAPAAKQAADTAQMHESAAKIADAQQKTGEAAKALPTDDTMKPETIGQKLEQQAQPLRQAATKLSEASKQATEANKSAQAQAQNAQQMAKSAAEQAKSMQQAKPNTPEAAEAATKAQQAEQTAATMKQKAEQAAAAQQTAQKAAEQARQVADRAEQMGKSLQAMAKTQQQQMAEAAGQQKPIEQAAQQASEDTARAARHEMRLGNEQMGQQLAQQAQKTGELAKNDVPEAKNKLMNEPNASAAKPAVQKAADGLAQQAKALASALSPAPAGDQKPPMAGENKPGEMKPAENKPGEAKAAEKNAEPSQPSQTASKPAEPGEAMQPSSQRPGGKSPFEGASAEYLARALDQVDRQLNASQAQAQSSQQQMAQAAQAQNGQAGQPQAGQPQQGQQGQSPSPSAAQQALQAAAAAQAASMAANRAQGLLPGESPLSQSISDQSTKGATVDAGNLAYTALPEAQRAADAQWGKLPPQLAKDLAEGRRESISPEYRAMVEAYYRALAQKAQQGGGK